MGSIQIYWKKDYKFSKNTKVTIIKTVNDDELFIKTIIFDDINEGENKNVIFEVGNFLGSHNLKINFISMIEIFPIKKIKYKIGLLNPTPKKWKLFKSMELHIKKHAEEEKVIREDVKYDNKNQTLSVVASYPNELARTKMENKITLCLKELRHMMISNWYYNKFIIISNKIVTKMLQGRIIKNKLCC